VHRRAGITTSLLVRLVLVTVVVVAAGAVLAHADKSGVDVLDRHVARWVTDHHPGGLVGAARVLALVGTTPGALLVVVLIGLSTWGERGSLFPLAVLLLAWGGSEVVARAAGLVGRHPPCHHALPPCYRPGGLGTGGPSFPAHHVLVGGAVLLALAAVLVGGGWWRDHRRITWTATAVLVAALAGGQLLLSGHWLTDVAVGLAAALGWVALLLPPVTRFVRRRGPSQPFPGLQAAGEAFRRFADDG
jgi:hypothetical protein